MTVLADPLSKPRAAGARTDAGKELDAGNEFYIAGGNLTPDSRSYIVRAADRELFEALQSGCYSYVLTARQMGKSSLMHRTAARMRDGGAVPVVVDLTAIGANLSPEQWYFGILMEIGSQTAMAARMERCWSAHGGRGALDRFLCVLMDAVSRLTERPLTVFIDEIDFVRGLPFSADEFFAGIRRCYNRRAEEADMRRLTFCLLGVAAPADLIRDARTTPFNIGRRIDLADFTLAETEVLAPGLDADEARGRQKLARIFYWASGHPYLTQKLCLAVSQRPGCSLEALDAVCHELFFSGAARSSEDNLIFVRGALRQGAEDLTAVLDQYRRVVSKRLVENDPADPSIAPLRLAGVVGVDDGRLCVRNRIYARVFDRRWIEVMLPEAEARRRRAAYRLGVARAVSACGAVTALVGVLAGTAIHQAHLARGEERAARRSEQQARGLLYVADMNMADQALHQNNTGRAIDLLREHAGDPRRDFDYGYLWRGCHQELFTTREHSLFVLDAAISPSGQRFATAGADGTVRVYGVHPMRLIQTLRYPGPCLSVAYSKDGSLLALAGAAGLRLVNTSTWRPSNGPPADMAREPLRQARFSPDGRWLAAVESKQVRLLSAGDGWRTVRTIRERRPIDEAAFHPDGKSLALATVGDGVKICDLTTGREQRTPDGPRSVMSLAFSRDGRRLALGSPDLSVSVLSTATLRQIASAKTGREHPYALVFSPNDRSVIVGGDQGIRALDLDGDGGTQTVPGHTRAVVCLAASPDGTWLLSGSLDGDAKGWRLPNIERARGAVSLSQQTASSPWRACAFSPDGRRLATATPRLTVQIWDAATGACLLRLPADRRRGTACAFFADGTHLAVSENDRWIDVYEVSSGRLTERIACPGGAIFSLACSPDGRLLAAGTDGGEIRLVDLRRRAELPPLTAGSSYASSLAFSRDGRFLAAATMDQREMIWNLTTGRAVFSLRGHGRIVGSMAFSPSGATLVTGGTEGTVKFWNIPSGRESLNEPVGAKPIRSLSFGPEGRFLRIADDANTIRTLYAGD